MNIEELRQSRDKAQVAFQEFALSTRSYPIHLFCFFEGKDNPYYVPRIKQFTDKYHPIKCGGRDRVLEVHKIVTNRPEYKDYKKAFFVDRDFNDPLKVHTTPIFETPCYSIENLYVSSDVFKEILTNEFGLSEINYETKNTFDICYSLFIERQREFHREICLFNTWYACLIDNKNTLGTETGVNLDTKLPKELSINIALEAITSNYNIEKIKQVFPKAIHVKEEQLNSKLTIFQECNASKVFRGKYEMQFLIKFIQLILVDSKSTKKMFKTKINFAFGDASLSNEQALSIFTTYAETPQSLKDYLLTVTQ